MGKVSEELKEQAFADYGSSGLTKFEYLASAQMAAMRSNPGFNNCPGDEIASRAIKDAAQLMISLKKVEDISYD
jgi:hypothetical protein